MKSLPTIVSLLAFAALTVNCGAGENSTIPDSVTKHLDNAFSGSEKHVSIWDCTAQYPRIRGFSFYYTRSSLSVPPQDRKELLLAVDLKDGSLHPISRDSDIKAEFEFLLRRTKRENLQDRDWIFDFCKLLAETLRSGSHRVIEGSSHSKMHMFRDNDISIENEVRAPLIKFEEPKQPTITFFTTNGIEEIWKHVAVLKIDGSFLSISGIRSSKEGYFTTIDEK